MRKAALLALLSLLATGAARAGDESPPRSYEEAIAAFPAPAASLGFAWKGVVEADGVRVGAFSLEAGALSDDRWHLAERLATTFEDVRTTTGSDLRADRRLVPVRGVLTETDEHGDTLTHTWRVEGEGYHVETRSPSRTPMQRTARREDPSLCGLVSLALFARLAPASPTVYATRTFHPDWDYLLAERPFVATKLTVSTGRGTDGSATLEVRAAEGEAETVVVLGAADRDLVEVRIHGRGPADLVLRPADVPDRKPAEDGDLFAVPSKTPRACAARVALAFATVDVDRFDRVIHWPTLRANMKASIRGNVTDEAFRDRILGLFREQARGREPQPKEEAETFLREQAPAFSVEMQGADDAVVTLSPAYDGMRLTLKRVDGGWRLVRLPGA